jgi:hypothetical protein
MMTQNNDKGRLGHTDSDTDTIQLTSNTFHCQCSFEELEYEELDVEIMEDERLKSWTRKGKWESAVMECVLDC